MDYESERTVEAKSAPGVRFTIARMSLARRIELAERVRELAGRVEFLEAGEDARGKLDAVVLRGEIDRVYLRWGLKRIEGLAIDGQAATAELLMEAGPEGLCREIAGAIKSEMGLSEEERKN